MLPVEEQYAAMELFRGTMVRHSLIAFANAVPALDFTGEAWRTYIPVRLPDTIIIREGSPGGASGVLINRNHSYTDLCLPIDGRRERLLNAVDGRRTIEEVAHAGGSLELARVFFRQLWEWDQVVFEVSGIEQPIQ